MLKSFACAACLLWGVALSAGEKARIDSASKVPAHFQPVHRTLADHVKRKEIAGAVALVLHEGRIVYFDSIGMRDVEAGRKMTGDTLFRIASMTKPVTTVAVLMLRDDGRLQLADPVSKYIPELGGLSVLKPSSDGGHRTVPAQKEITIRDLLSHTSGFSYGFFGQEPLGKLYAEAGISDGLIETSGTIASTVSRLSGVPLAFEPGSAWQYGLSTDVLGRLVEVVSGQTLDEFFLKRIFQPLGMTDTHFFLPPEKVERLAALYRPAKEGTIRRVEAGPQRSGALSYSATFHSHGPRTYFSGGAGLVSTAPDYARFLQMLLNGGELEGTRILKAETVAEMTRNQIGDLDCAFAIHGSKFGYGVGVHSEQGERHGASVGAYSWGGIFNTFFWADPKRQMAGIIMTQLYPSNHLPLWAAFQSGVYAALAPPAPGAPAKTSVFQFKHHVIDQDLSGNSFGQTALADLDGDGKPEFIMGQRNGPVYVYRYQAPDRWNRHIVGQQSPSDVGLCVLDADGDGRVDLVAGGVWYRNSGDSTRPFDRIVFDAKLQAVHDMTAADVDGDGRSDVLTMSDRNNLRWYKIPSDATQPWQRHDIGKGVHAGLSVGDLNGDGRLDVVRTDVWFENADGKGTRWIEHFIGANTPPPPDFRPAFAFDATRSRVLDMNSDGHNDIVFTDGEIPGGKVWWMENVSGNGTVWRRHDVPLGDEVRRGAYHTLHVADFDGDADFDIFSCEMEAVRGKGAPRWYIWENLDGKGTAWKEHVILDVNLGGHEAVVGDITGNGKLDIISKPWTAHRENALGGKPFVIFLENISQGL